MTRAAAQKIAEDRAAEEAAAKAAAEALAAEEAAAEAHAANVARAKAAASQAHAAEKAALMEATAANVANRDQTPESISALRTAIDKARAAEAAARKAEEDVVRASDPALAGAADILCDLKRKALQRMVSIKTVPNRPVSSGMQADGDTIAKGIEDLEGRHRELEAGQILLLLRYSSGS
ncbi:hypothetical protein SCUCBS95973_000920 [Sporothrix curviconia]|uniref:TolA protein n=1 Tax=Sporothrix curviconia TaxID=1260050 RepID=A0ABP0AUL2_9PEZI